MAYRLYEVYWIPPEIISLDPNCEYEHPFVIFELANDGAYVLAISTKIHTLYDSSRDILVRADESGFETTGLSQDSFIKNQEFFLPGSYEAKLRRAGMFSGDLLDRFQGYIRRFFD